MGARGADSSCSRKYTCNFTVSPPYLLVHILGSCSTIICISRKKSLYKWTKQFKLMLFKVQLYYYKNGLVITQFCTSKASTNYPDLWIHLYFKPPNLKPKSKITAHEEKKKSLNFTLIFFCSSNEHTILNNMSNRNIMPPDLQAILRASDKTIQDIYNSQNVLKTQTTTLIFMITIQYYSLLQCSDHVITVYEPESQQHSKNTNIFPFFKNSTELIPG